jgi:hypothetical protein
MRKRIWLSVLAAIVAAALMAGSAGAGTPPNRLDDNRFKGTPVELASDICNAILGPFQVFSWFDLDVCPSMSPRVISSPHIWNVFASGNWDGTHPPVASDAAINDLTRKIIDTTAGNNYLGPAGQYGIGAATFQGSSQNNGCTGAPSGTTNQLSIQLWITCEVQAPGTGVPYPDGNTIYVIYLPWNVDINNGPFGGTCDKFDAYHLQSMALTVDGPKLAIPPFDVSWQSYPYAVIPLKCATVGGAINVDKLTDLMSHEIVEAATDPISLGGWVDNSTFNFSGDFLKEGEAADICESIGSAPDTRERRLENGITVSSYWSNADRMCVPLLRKLTLQASGLPAGVTGKATVTSRAIFNDTAPHTFDLPKTLEIVDGARVEWKFTSPLDGEAAGVRYVTSNPGGSTPLTIDTTSTATYTKEFRLTVNASPATVSPPSLTPSKWVPAGQTVGITTDAFVPSGVDRYRFNGWSGDASGIFEDTDVVMDAPKTATANYKLQHQITFQQTGIPAGVPWTVNVDGTDHAGPYSVWFDEFDFVDFGFQDPVPALTAGTRYSFVNATASSPLFVLATGPVTATYKTQHLLTVRTSGLPSPNLTTITNGTTTLGTANDATPLSTWVDDGTALSLAGDADVNGVDGTQYFAQTFSPAPPATLTGPFDTTLTYKTMKQLIQEALANGGLTGPNAAGVGKALLKIFASVEADMGDHRYVPALGDLEAFISLVQGQCCTPKSGKALTPPTATTLQLDALLVYHAALCLAAPQLSAQHMSDDYAYYTTLVTNLGGKVLPPCA